MLDWDTFHENLRALPEDFFLNSVSVMHRCSFMVMLFWQLWPGRLESFFNRKWNIDVKEVQVFTERKATTIAFFFQSPFNFKNPFRTKIFQFLG